MEMLATALHACGTTVNAATTGASGGGGFGLPITVGAAATYVIAATIFAIGFFGLALMVTLSRRGAPPAPALAPMPLGARISPDGLYWWDGAAWRPVR